MDSATKLKYELLALQMGMFGVNDIMPKDTEKKIYKPKVGEVFAVLEGGKIVRLAKSDSLEWVDISHATFKCAISSFVDSEGNYESHAQPELEEIGDGVFKEVGVRHLDGKFSIYVRIDPTYWDKIAKIRELYLSSLNSLFGNIFEGNCKLLAK